MLKKSILRGIELRNRLEQAKSNETISLPLLPKDFGEYQGPIILKKPVTLVGMGEKTPILGRGCPAIIVLSKNVRLVNLELSDTLDPSEGVALLMDDRAEPNLENVQCSGKKVVMSKEQLIDMGYFLPQQKASSYLEIEVFGPTTLKCADSTARWLQISPNSLPGAGKYLIQFSCNGTSLGPGVMAVGNVEIITGTDRNNLWVTVWVLPSLPPKLLTDQIALRVTKGYSIRFADGFILGRNRFPGVSSANSIEERQAIILKEPGSNIWTIFQPWKTSIPTTINKQLISQGQRCTLQEGDILRAGNLELKVEIYKGGGVYSVDRGTIEFGTISSTPAEQVFKLLYSSGGKDKPQIITTVPWIKVSSTNLEFKSGETKEVRVILTPDIMKFPIMKHRERSALLVQTKNEVISLDVTFELVATTIIPRLSSDHIDFGPVSDWKTCQSTLIIYNDGPQEWKPSIQVDCDWLDIEPGSLLLPPGKNASVLVRCNAKIEKLTFPADLKASVKLDGDGVNATFSVAAHLDLDTVIPILETPLLDFGEIPSVDQGQTISAIIRNKGRKDWSAAVKLHCDWLEITGDRIFVLSAGKQQTISVGLNDKLPFGKQSIEDAVTIEGDGKSLKIPIKVELKARTEENKSKPRVRSVPVEFGEISGWEGAPLVTIPIYNEGNADWVNVQVATTAPWITAEPGVVQVPQNGKTEIKIRLNEALENLPSGQYKLPDAVILSGDGIKLPVKLSLVLSSSELHASEQSIIFAVNENALPSEVQQKIKITNTGAGDWSGKIGIGVPWLKVEPEQARIRTKETLNVMIGITDEIFKFGTGEQTFGKIITFEKSPLALDVTVSIKKKTEVSEILEFEPSSIIFDKIDPKNAPLLLIKKLTVSCEQNWEASVQVQDHWLKISPGAIVSQAGEKVNCVVELLDDEYEQLSEGVHWSEICFVTKRGRKFNVPVKIEKIGDVPKLVIMPDPLQFSWHITDGEFEPQEISIDNKDSKDWEIWVDIKEDWLEINPAKRVICPANGQVIFLAKLTPEVKSLNDGNHFQDIEIRVGSKHRIPKHVILNVDHTVADWSISDEGIVFGSVARSELWDRCLPVELSIQNNGNQEINLNLNIKSKGIQWLEAPSLLTIPPHTKRKTRISLIKGIWKNLKLGKLDSILEISGGGKPRGIFATLNLISDRGGEIIDRSESGKTKFEAKIEPTKIVFTEMDPSKWAGAPEKKIIVTNLGNTTWEDVLVQYTTWLSVEPKLFSLPAFGSVELRVKLKASPFTRSGENLDQEDAIVISHKTEKRNIQVLVGQNNILPESTIPESIGEIGKENIRPVKLFAEESSMVSSGEQTGSLSLSRERHESGKSANIFEREQARGLEKTVERIIRELIFIEPNQIDFGQVVDFSKANVTIKLRNDNSGSIKVIVSSAKWLRVTPSDVVCPAKEQITLQVSLIKPTSIFSNFQNGVQSDSNGLVVTAGDYSFPISVSVEIL